MERNNNGGLEKEKSGVKSVGWSEILLRILAFLLTLAAAIITGVNRQTKIVPINISPDLPAFYVPVLAKSSYVSAFVYFVVANAIACVFAVISLVLALATKGGRKAIIILTITLMDLMMVALLFSCVGAAGAVGVLGVKGNSHLRWNKICNVYGKYCHRIEAAVALSFFAAIAYFLLVLLSVSRLSRGS